MGVASGSGWNLWVWLLGVVVRRYIDFLTLLIPTPLVSVLFSAASLLFVHFFKCFSFLSILLVSITPCQSITLKYQLENINTAIYYIYNIAPCHSITLKYHLYIYTYIYS